MFTYLSMYKGIVERVRKWFHCIVWEGIREARTWRQSLWMCDIYMSTQGADLKSDCVNMSSLLSNKKKNQSGVPLCSLLWTPRPAPAGYHTVWVEDLYFLLHRSICSEWITEPPQTQLAEASMIALCVCERKWTQACHALHRCESYKTGCCDRKERTNRVCSAVNTKKTLKMETHNYC